MKHTLNKTVYILLMLAGMTGLATAQELNVAVLDIEAALFSSARAEAMDAELQAETADDQERVRELATEAEELNQRLTLDASTMSADEQRRINSELEQVGVQYQYLLQKLETTVQERRQQFQQSNVADLQEAVRQVLEEGGYDLVVNTGSIIHINPEKDLDITARVIERFNQM